MTHREVELLAVGAGPANLAMAVALEELAPDLAERSLLIERQERVSWQPGMLLREAQSQVSFLKDLVTQRNPLSRFSFVNYLHSIGRLDDFINLGTFTPYRSEMSEYFAWVASELAKVRLECGRSCESVTPRRSPDGTVTGWLTRLADGSTVGSRYLVIGAGRDPHVPAVFGALPAGRLIHSTEYTRRVAELPKDRAYRVVVIGGAQSAAEMFNAVQADLPGCHRTLVMRSIGLSHYETGKFTNELYFPSFTDEFFRAQPRAREQILAEMHRTNYAGLSPDLLDSLYRQLYLDRLHGEERLRVVTLADVTGAVEQDGEVRLELTDRKSGAAETLACDLVLLGTGFVRELPASVRRLQESLGLERVEVSRHYRLLLDGPATGACYLQGINEATHGIPDSLLSVLAVRGAEIATDVAAHRRDTALAGPGAEHLLSAATSAA
ncbi:SidA/IucD/PvdA family monooxygenase [Kitasatospora sp. NPDC059571]|uniref:SidA/IucD/PvdA family monooxygenase n=1 Tax=Kitasatospora sp. NPDC059571 TaxID=3346871 RepID=UPI0036855E6E